ncbi:MAG: DUF2202 domain-containing protein [Chloroflexi bacterium]|nr:DUF2202 domain-containing protein [Chloroflexota bacterium]
MDKTITNIIITALLALALGITGCTTQLASNISPTEQVVIVVTATSEPIIPISAAVEPTIEVILPAPEATAPASETTLENLAMGLNAEEAAALLFMIEEEKLARDVYNTLFATWNVQIFQNIAGSEQTHVDQIGLLISNYNLPNPTQAPGIFTDQNLQALYNTLITQGKQSLNDAIKVGGAVEEIDILDLQTRLSKTDNADIQLAYNNLLNGSYNHLKSFANTLSTQGGEIYSQQYLTAEQYQTILNSTQGNGTGQGKGKP